MDELNELPEDIKEKVLESFLAKDFLNDVTASISHIPIHDRRVSVVGTTFSVAISGVVDSEMIKEQVNTVLSNLKSVKHLTNTLTVYQCKRKVNVTANGTNYAVKNLQELQGVFEKYKHEVFVCYSLKEELHDTILKLRMNRTSTSAMFYDSGKKQFIAATYKAKHDNKLIHRFTDENGNPVNHPDKEVVANRDGFDIMRHFLLLGEKFDGVEWN
jgi:hypothetical protein